ncbi:MAG TPA: hypothetical protein VL946_14625 [Lacibacter sp.]|nr:hypothetical protein [Lacibacter sp.]
MKHFLITLLIASTVLSCSRDSVELKAADNEIVDVSVYSEYLTGKSIATDINFMPDEQYINHNSNAPHPPLLTLRLVTKQVFPCVNYLLKTTKFIKGNELIIRFDEVADPGVCLTAIGPAGASIDLPENINKIVLINGNKIDVYSTDINEEKITLTALSKSFTNALYNKTFRIPKNSFAFVCGTNTVNTHLYQDFLTILERNTSFKEFKFEGEGRVPYPVVSGGHWANHPSKFFIYSNRAEFEKLDNILNTFSSEKIEKNSGVTIALYGWNNSKYYSWD